MEKGICDLLMARNCPLNFISRELIHVSEKLDCPIGSNEITTIDVLRDKLITLSNYMDKIKRKITFISKVRPSASVNHGINIV